MSPYKKDIVPCGNPECNHPIGDIEIGFARAFLEYWINQDKSREFKVECEHCGTTTRYSYPEILAMIPRENRPGQLPNDTHWGVILVEIEASPDLKYHGYLGERVLVRVYSESRDSWIGTTLNYSQFAPALLKNTTVSGGKVSGFYICQSIWENSGEKPLPIEGIPQNSILGTFFSPKNDELRLYAANPFCTNASCGYIFGLTYSQFKNIATHGESQLPRYNADEATIVATCNVCGTSVVISELTFEKLFRV